MPWQKQGLIFCPRGEYEWNRSHAQIPVADHLNNDTLRIYYGTRDAKNRTHTSYIDVDASNPGRILYEHDAPILPLGKLGSFDDCGVMPSWVLDHEGCKYLYYIGWTVRNTVPYHNSIGLAISDDGGSSFQRFSDGPLFSPTVLEPYFTGTSCVLIENGVWKNWYLSCTKWEMINGRAEPFYHLKYAESGDGICWRREGRVAVDYKSGDEGGIVKASVQKRDGRYEMWYAYRKGWGYRDDISRSYRIGYAESVDGIEWCRLDDKAQIDVSIHGWDSRMLTYPHVIDHGPNRYLFYNGNKFGQTGFGYARWVD